MKTWSECEVEAGVEVFAERIDDFGIDCRLRNYVASFSFRAFVARRWVMGIRVSK